MTNHKTLNQVRKSFLDYFEKNSHEVLQSFPLVPHNDPTLMFTNAGMVPFKNVFAGREPLTGKNGKEIKKVTSSQKCVRAGGKHNDLDNVGYTARHHTFFEMLGNFSFGDYFKEQAILYAWEYLTEILGLPKEKLLATVYHDDDEAFDLWRKISGLPEEKIIRISTNDNFWAMGDTGPCGPCSEIFYDHGEKVPGGPPGSKDQDGDRFTEIWNLVFMQFEKLDDGSKINLPNPCIDTGMGLERITTIMQGVFDNYDIDLFKNLIAASKEVSGNDNPKKDFSHRIIADHLRSVSFLIADGVLPSNEGRGYVLRRIMRRAMRHCHALDNNHTIMHKLVPSLIDEMGGFYPELERARSLIEQTLEQEENKFRETLGHGLKLLKDELANINDKKELDGKIAFKLYDTYGFPFDLTKDILREKGMGVDQKGFDKAMEEQKNVARKSWSGSGEASEETIWLDLNKEFGHTEFIGYETTKGRGNLTAIVKDGKKVDKLKKGEEGFVIANQTPFYAESGGQAGDQGQIRTETGTFAVNDTKKFADGIHAHFGKVIEGEINPTEMAKMIVHPGRRAGVKRAHSATHILHAALRNILGDFVTQKGSMVEDDYLRFDFSCPNSIEEGKLREIELEANRIIMQNTDSETRVMPVKQAMDLGAVALFGEKYGDEVRVISMGDDNYSMEFCGGTHVKRTGDIGMLKIFSEQSISSGVRRIEAYTGIKAIEHSEKLEKQLNQIQQSIKSSADDIVPRIEKLMSEKRDMEKEIAELKKQVALGSGSNGGSKDKKEAEDINGVNFIAKFLPGIQPRDLRGLIDEYKSRYENAVILLISENDGKAGIAAGVSEALISKYNAVDLVKKSSEILGGKGGGGRPDFAQGGAPSADNATQAIAEIKKSV